MMGILLTGCTQQQERHYNKSSDDYAALYAKITVNVFVDAKRCFAMLDSVEQTGDYPPEFITMTRGALYSSSQNYMMGEPMLLSVFNDKLYQLWPYGYYKTAVMLTMSTVQRDNLEGGLRVATEALKRQETETDPDLEVFKWTLMSRVASCHIRLRQFDECQQVLEKAYQGAKAVVLKQQDNKTSRALCMLCLNAVTEYLICIPDQMPLWLERSEEAIRLVEQTYKADVEKPYLDYCQAKLLAYKAAYLGAIGKYKEAQKFIDEFMKTDLAKSPETIIDKFNFYYFTKQWDKAADYLKTITDIHYKKMKVAPTLTSLCDLGLSFRVYEQAGRQADAMEMGRMMAGMVDSVRFYHMKDQAAEMATLYETKEKDAEIAQQQIELSQQRLIGLAIAIVLLTLFFIIYTLHRRRAARRLADMKAAQERIESELRIARNIQMSMVPSIFPEREGLDMYASMTPAKEVGGDLYGYLLLGDKLYFAIGDVSGKGVPASLFMAQATRLFLTLAKQGMMPAEICTRMNDALSGDDNENGMFVTFWLGLLDLQTGHLDFCNAGHNPPVIGGGDHHGDFLDMLPNAPIGLWPGLEYEGEEIATIQGRALFVYTDGLNEAEDPQQQQFGDDRLLSILRDTHFDSARQVIDTLKASVDTHRNGAEPNDDLTMLCLRLD